MTRRPPTATVERIVHFQKGEWIKDGEAHFGFRDGSGRFYAINHQRHAIALLEDGRPRWTLAAAPILEGVRNITAELKFPMYADTLPDGGVVVSNLGNARLYRVDPERMCAECLVDGHRLGLADMGNCVVDADGFIWVNEVTGCCVRRFDATGRLVLTLGDGTAGFQPDPVGFDAVRFNWIYDLRRSPDGTLFVLDSRNYALRAIDPADRHVRTLAVGFGSDPSARWDGPISLSLDDAGNAYVGDRFNHVVRHVDPVMGELTTIAGSGDADTHRANDPDEYDPLRLRLPAISSMDYADGCLYVPTDLAAGAGDLTVLRLRPPTARPPAA